MSGLSYPKHDQVLRSHLECRISSLNVNWLMLNKPQQFLPQDKDLRCSLVSRGKQQEKWQYRS